MCGPARLILTTYLMSLLPVLEGRYAIVAAESLGLSATCAFIVASLGVVTLSIALPILLPFADRLAQALESRGTPILGRLAALYLAYSARARRRAKKYADKYGFPGLVLFVMIPLPATGIWTGAIGSHLLGMSRSKMGLGLLIGGLLSNMLVSGVLGII